jgi:hypothetical protein
LLRTYVPIPHLAAAPGATGTIVVGWQIDSALQQKEIPEAIRLGYFRRGERFEFDVSAGRDRSRPGDGLGFDACGSGAAALRALEPYGNIGSHGSMDDLLAAGLQKQTPSDESMRDEVSKNDTCLAREAGYTIRSFASPAGETPPALIHAIDSIGLTGYSYSGDAGAAPTRAWVDAQSPAEGAWAFPIMPSGDARSLADMQRSGFEQSQVAQWLDDTTAYAERERTIVSISSNLDDLLRTGYGSTWAAFLDRLEPQLRAGEVQMLDVPQAAAFLDKFVATAFAFRRLSGSLAVELRNPQGLGGIGFAVPQAWLGSAPTPAELSDRGITDGFHYFTVATQATDLTVRFASVR